MIEVRFHGRGGQGAVIGSKIMAMAIFSEGRYAQAFPAFGVERRGAPVTAFLRVNSTPINIRNEIYTPDHLIVLDHTLMNNEAIFAGLKKGGWILVNSKLIPPFPLGSGPPPAKADEASGLFDAATKGPDPKKGGEGGLIENRLAYVDASGIAVRNRLGSSTSPIVNTAILGAFAKITGICSIDSVCAVIKKSVPIKPEENAKAAREAYDEVTEPAK